GQPVDGSKKNLHVVFSLGEDLDRYKDLLHACPHHGFTELHQFDTFYNALNPADQDSLNSAAGGNLLERRTQDVLTIIENKSKIAKLTHAVNQQTSVVTTAMTAILKQFQATPPPASIKAVKKICVTYGGAHPYYQCLAADGNTFSEFRDNIQGYVSTAAINYNLGNSGYRPLGVANQIRPSGFAQPNVQNNQNRFSQPQGYNQGNNFNQDQYYQAPTQQNQEPPPQNGPPPMVRPNGQAPRTIEELCQPSINGRGGPIAPIPIQAIDFGLRRHMIQQVQNTCQFHGLPGDDADQHIDKFLEITQHLKQNGVSDDALHLSLFP
nr:reverse transcriptase domain-containing protein [Tanacetum cinerariifolium]